MADLGVLARLTQQASDNIFREQESRSRLFAQARQEIQQDRQLRLLESNAIANRMNKADENIARSEQNAIMNQQRAAQLAEQKAYHNARIKATGASSGFGGYVPIGAGGGGGNAGVPDASLPTWGYQDPPNLQPGEVGNVVAGKTHPLLSETPIPGGATPPIKSKAETPEEQEALFQGKAVLNKAKTDLEKEIAIAKANIDAFAAPIGKVSEEVRKDYAAKKARAIQYHGELKGRLAEVDGALSTLGAVRETKPNEGLSSAEEEKFHKVFTDAQRWGEIANQKGKMVEGVEYFRVGDETLTKNEVLRRKAEAEAIHGSYLNRMTPAQKEASAARILPSTQGPAGPNPNVLREKAAQGNADAKNILNLLK